jgi:signal transduction histidine kinase
MANQATKIETPSEYQKLMEAFEAFNRTSAELQKSYDELQSEARRLSIELAETNAELERNLREKERVKSYLKNILESLTTGVMVFSQTGELTIFNPAVPFLLNLDSHHPVFQGPEGITLLPEELTKLVQESLTRDGCSMEEIEIKVKALTAKEKERFLTVSTSRLKNQAEENDGLILILKDISRLKELEYINQRAQRLQAMGEMAVQLAHEIRNPLGSIELFASLIRQEVPGGGDVASWTDQVVTGVKFLNTVVTNMLSFSRGFEPHYSEFDFIEMVNSTMTFLDPVFQQREIQVDRPTASSKLQMEGDPDILKQMLMNLLMNALHAMPAKGRISIAVNPQGEDELCLEVADTGIGIPPEHLEKVFDPFFTTSERGNGLGLALVHQIVHKHQGRIAVKSQLGQGTCFTILFPRRINSGSMSGMNTPMLNSCR